MKILMVGLVDYTKVTGGVIHQSSLVRWMVAAGHDVVVLAPRTGPPDQANPWVRDRLLQTPTYRRHGVPPFLDSLFQLGAIWAQVRRSRPDVLYSRSNPLNVIVTLFGRMLGIPVVTEHNTWLSAERIHRRGRTVWYDRLEVLAQVGDARCSNAVRTVTEGIRDLMLAEGVEPGRVSVIGNGADPEVFHPLDRNGCLARWGLDTDAIYLGFIGSLTRWHGVHVAVSAMAALRESHPGVRLLVFGDGPEGAALRDQARQEGVADRVRFLGRVPLDEANVAINCFDVALAPFSRELYARVGVATVKLGDYAAAGRPVVGSDLPGLREMARGGWIDLVEPDDPAALARGVDALLSDRDRCLDLGRRAREAAEGGMGWRGITERVLGILESVRR
jgi:glycosyltransferase involved in cell wall biosynthesis